MSGAEFNFSSKKDVEDPLYLDGVASRPRGGPAFDPAPDAPEDPDRPLRLDLAAREPGRTKGGIAFVIAGVVIVLVAAAAAVRVVRLPSSLQVRPGRSAAPAQAVDANLASQAGPVTAAATLSAVQEEAAPVAQTQTSQAPVDLLTPPDVARRTAAAHEHARAHAHAHAVPKAQEEAGERRPPHTVMAKRLRSRHAEAAMPRRRAPEEFKLDALAKSLQ